MTRARAATIPITARRRARCCARCRRARCRAARRERGVAIGATVADVQPLLNGRSALGRPLSGRIRAATIRRMSEPSGPTIRVPRWIQLVGLPVGLLSSGCWPGSSATSIFLFLVAAVIAFLLNPLVRDLQRLRLPRGARRRARLPPLRHRRRLRRARARQRRRRPDPLGDRPRSTTTSPSTDDGGKTGAEQDIDRLQHWLDTHRPRADPDREAGDRLGRQPRRGRDLEVHAGRALVRPGSRVLDRRDALQHRPDRRDRDLHAARHGAARAARRPPLSARGPACR